MREDFLCCLWNNQPIHISVFFPRDRNSNLTLFNFSTNSGVTRQVLPSCEWGSTRPSAKPKRPWVCSTSSLRSTSGPPCNTHTAWGAPRCFHRQFGTCKWAQGHLENACPVPGGHACADIWNKTIYTQRTDQLSITSDLNSIRTKCDAF